MKLSFAKKVSFAFVTAAAFFLMVEGLLTIIAWPKPSATPDPYVGFSDLMPLMQTSTNEDGVVKMVTAPDKLRLFNDQSFSAVKADGVRRVFCVGGSTTFGRPFSDSTSYCGYLRELLPIADSSARWEVINAGGVSYASYRMAAVMQELSQYQPDLFIVYSAHNEFLERRTYASMFDVPRWRQVCETILRKTKIFAAIETVYQKSIGKDDSTIQMLPGEVDERLNHTIGPSDYVRDEEWQVGVTTHYEANLRRMVEIARAAGAKIVFIEPACNEKDCSPFKDEDGFYEIGQSLFLEGDYEAAREAFAVAIDRDVCPLRATSTISALVQRVSEDENVPLVPFDQRLRQRCRDEWGHPCLGREYFLDHVHPTIQVHRDLACWIIETLQSSSLIGGQPLDSDAIATVDETVLANISVSDQAIAFRNLAKVMHWSGKFTDAARHAEDCLRLMPNDAEALFVLADCLTQLGRPDEAITTYKTLFSVHDYERAMLPFAYLLADQGHFETAKAYATLATASAKAETRDTAFELLWQIHETLGENDLAEQTIQRKNILKP